MPVSLADLNKTPNPPLLPSSFKSGTKLSVKSPDDDQEDLISLFNKSNHVRNIYYKGSEEQILPNIAYLINNNIDFRSILILLVSCGQAQLAIEFIKYLEKNHIFMPIEKPYGDDRNSPNLFTTIASFNDSSVTRQLFKHGIEGLKIKIKTESPDISAKELETKVKEYVEDLLSINPVSGKLSTLEYVILTISPVGFVNEGLTDRNNKIQVLKLIALACDTSGSKEGLGDLQQQYNLPWYTIKMLVDIGDEYGIDLRELRSRSLDHGEKIFDALEKAIENKDGMNKLVNKFRFPYARDGRKLQKTEVDMYGANNQDYFYTVDIDPMHYDAEPSSVIMTVSSERFKKGLESAISRKAPALAEAVEERLRRHSQDLGQQRQDLRRHSGDMSSIKVTVERVERDVENLKLDVKDLKQDAAKLKDLVERHLADELIFENLGDNEFLKRLYIEVRDAIIAKLNDALQGNPDRQFELLCKNAAILGGAIDFAAGFAGAPGVIGASFNILIYVSKYFEKVREKQVSKEMNELLLGSLDLPKIIAVGVAESIALKAKENIHDRKFKLDEQKHIIQCIEDLVSRQLSGAHLDKLFEILKGSRVNLFEIIQDVLMATIIEGKPFTSPFLRSSELSFSEGHKYHHHKHAAHDMVRSLINPSPKLEQTQSVSSDNPDIMKGKGFKAS